MFIYSKCQNMWITPPVHHMLHCLNMVAIEKCTTFSSSYWTYSCCLTALSAVSFLQVVSWIFSKRLTAMDGVKHLQCPVSLADFYLAALTRGPLLGSKRCPRCPHRQNLALSLWYFICIVGHFLRKMANGRSEAREEWRPAPTRQPCHHTPSRRSP